MKSLLAIQTTYNFLSLGTSQYCIFTGEAMEQGLQDCCRSIRIGKILIQSDDDDLMSPKLFYAKLPRNIASKRVLLMYPILC